MAGACKDKFLSMLCSSDHFLNMKPLGASKWEVIVTFPKSARAVMDGASGWAASIQLGLNALSTCYSDAVEDEESWFARSGEVAWRGNDTRVAPTCAAQLLQSSTSSTKHT